MFKDLENQKLALGVSYLTLDQHPVHSINTQLTAVVISGQNIIHELPMIVGFTPHEMYRVTSQKDWRKIKLNEMGRQKIGKADFQAVGKTHIVILWTSRT